MLQFGSVDIHLGAQSGKYPDGNQVVVRGSDVCVAFDTPLASRSRTDLLSQVELVILGHVHEDHVTALDLMPHAAVMAHALDVAAVQSWEGLCTHYGYAKPTLAGVHAMVVGDFHYAPRPDALPYQDQHHWDLGGGVRIRAHHLPGHTSGHCALVVENDGVAFIGDIDLSGFGPYYGDATSSLSAFRQTLCDVADLDAKVWVTSHHRAVITDRAQFLQDLARFASRIEERTERLLHSLQAGPRSVSELASAGFLYPAGHSAPWTLSAEQRTLQQHLDELVDQHRVQLHEGRYALI